jgi:hypothetical protein
MKKNIISRTIALSMLSIALVFVLSGCGSNKEQSKEKQKDTSKLGVSAEDLKKPMSQEDVDKELKAIDEDLKSISTDNLKDADLNDVSL